MDIQDAPEIWVCNKCRIGLHFLETLEADGTYASREWIHARPVEYPHSPEPVKLSDIPGGEIRTVCDICSLPDPMNLWFTSGSGGTVELPGRGTLQMRDRDNAWLVCDDCETLISQDRLLDLLKRCYTSLQAKYPDTKLTTTQRALIADRVRVFMETRLGTSQRRTF